MTDLQNTQLRKLLRNARMVKDNNARIVQTLVAQVDRLTADRDAWRKLVREHNTLRNAQCRNCRETCGDCCPAAYVIHVPPELEQSP